jgi:hypothetical protein
LLLFTKTLFKKAVLFLKLLNYNFLKFTVFGANTI